MPVLFALMTWGNRWAAGQDGPSVRLRHHGCGQHATAEVTCAHCSQPLTIEDLTMEAGSGGRAGPGTRLIAERLHRQVR